MNKPIHVKPSFYSFIFEDAKIIAKEFGYNLVLHGSMNRDLDLIAIPWVDDPKDEFELIQALDLHLTGLVRNTKEQYMYSILPGNRHSYVINLNRGGYWNFHEDKLFYLDISITPFNN